MNRLLVVVALAWCWSCTRGLEEVRPFEAEPDFLGEYSGVYRGLETGGDDIGRTVVIHLRDKIAMSPFEFVDGVPRLSRFASVATVPEVVTEPVRTESIVTLAATETGMWPATATCDPTENDHWASVPPAQLIIAVQQRAGQCQASPSTCRTVCYMPNMYDPSEGMLGRCVGDGTVCSYPITVYGRVGRDVVELLFDQNTVAPAPEFERLVCTEPNNDGWQRCTPYAPGCEGWATCKFLDKLCDFDSRLAGVYQAELRRDGSEPRVVELAVAIANNVSAIILFLSDERLGDRLLIGNLDPASMEFSANDGESPMDAGWSLRDGREPDIQVSGTTESRSDSTDEVYSLSASRLSGVTVGTACRSMSTCEAPPLTCPLGNTVQIRGSSLQIQSDITDAGCVVSDCQRVLDTSSLCEPLPSCGGRDAGDQVFETYDLWLSPPTCPPHNSNCSDNDKESCVRFVCHDDTFGPATAANWYRVDSSCSGVMVMEQEGQAGVRIQCGGGQICPTTAPACPMGFSNEVETALRPRVNDDGCVAWECEQFFVPDEICADVTPPICAATELLVPAIRAVDGASDCIDLVCQPGCDNTDCNSCGLCGPFDVTSCGTTSIRVSSDCGGCVRTECNPSCPYGPAICPLGDTGAFQTRLVPESAGDGCVGFACEQYYRDHQVCGSSPTSCSGGETLVPGLHPTDGCVEYSCELSTGGEIDPTTCDDWVRVRRSYDGKMLVDCELLPCAQHSVDCPVDIPLLQQEFRPQLDSLNCLYLQCTQYYDPNNMCSGAALPSALGCGGGDVPTLVERAGFGCLEHVCAPSCTSSCVDCGGACSDASYPDGCNVDEVVVVTPECGDCVYAQCQRL